MASTKLYQAMYEHKVFANEDLREVYGQGKRPPSLQSELQYNRRRGYIGRIRTGLYYILPFGEDPKTYVVDRFLVGHKVAPDAIIGYHSALELLGAAYTPFNTVYVLSKSRRAPFTFQGMTYRQVYPPTRLITAKAEAFGVEKLERSGVKIAVTGKERTVVDCVDRLAYTGGLEELFRSVELLPYLDLEKLAAYLDLLAKGVLYAEVGFLLDGFAKKFDFTDPYRRRFARHLPKVVYYFGGQQGQCRYVKAWNLMVPMDLAQKLEIH